jgi:hypothetical protein
VRQVEKHSQVLGRIEPNEGRELLHSRFVRASAGISDKLPVWPAISIVILVVFSEFLPAEFLSGLNLYLMVLAAIVWITSGKRFDPNLLRAIVPFAVIAIFGLAVGIGADRYLYFKDAWYVLNPPLVIVAGYVLFRCMPDVASGLRAVVSAGTIVGLFYLVRFAFNPQILSQSAVDIRDAVGLGYASPVLALIILLTYARIWGTGLKVTRWIAACCCVVCLLATALSFSRTNLIMLGIGVLAAAGLLARREVRRVVFIVCAGTVAIGTLHMVVDTDLRSINENWRGYETAKALTLYRSGSALQLLFGYGFGAQVDVGLFMKLGSPQDRHGLERSIPILHNGYAYLLVKGGAVAVGLFLSAMAWLYLPGRSIVSTESSRLLSAPARVLQACAVILAVTTWFVGGVFNKNGLFPFLLASGFILAAVSTYGERHATAAFAK